MTRDPTRLITAAASVSAEAIPGGADRRVAVGPRRAAPRDVVLSDLCLQLVMAHHAPAAVLIDRHHECLYSMGPTDRYLRIAPGFPTHDLLASVAPELRTELRWAIHQALETGVPVQVNGATRTSKEGASVAFDVIIRPVVHMGNDVLFICFVDSAAPASDQRRRSLPGDGSQTAQLEGELTASKDELTALNGQLLDMLDRQRTTFDDLQNVLYSTDVATIFLDAEMTIRFFTPATTALFRVLPGDVGRPLADLTSFAEDGSLLADARAVVLNSTPLESDVEGRSGAWFARRIVPFRAHDGEVGGVVITFIDITDQKRISVALEDAKQRAELANLAKSRFLASASHDLRQPLQTLALLQSLLARTVQGEKALKLVAKIDETIDTMSGMLNALLDINQIEAGTVHARFVEFPIDDVLRRMHDEFAYQAEAQALVLRVVPCGLWITSDPRLLEQMIRNLVSNALKYTKHGKVLLGCRRHEDRLSIEVWDTGVGIEEADLQTIFQEYYQIDNPDRAPSHGLGLGLAIVDRLGTLMGHKVHARSTPGRGSAFSIEVRLSDSALAPRVADLPFKDEPAEVRSGTARNILLVEDDPEVRTLLKHLLTEDGYDVTAAPDGVAAMGLVAGGTTDPDLLLCDYNLPNDLNGVQIAAKLRKKLKRNLPTIILTGDISTDALRNIAREDFVQLNKPVKIEEMTEAIRALLAVPAPLQSAPLTTGDDVHLLDGPVIFVVDDDPNVRESLRLTLEDDGRNVEDFASCEAFLKAFSPGREGLLLVDAHLPGMSGLALLQRLHEIDQRLPAIMITGTSDVATAVQAMRCGASDFIEKPVGRMELLASVKRALTGPADSKARLAWQETSTTTIEGLTPRQLEIMEMVLAGHPSKNIAVDLGISQRTVESHRASIMKKTGSKSLPALARLALAAQWNVRDVKQTSKKSAT
ncbi:FixJ family two-component response regulator/signal transduction histidine kinase [Rhodoligotrophos appendicifer]|uniref:response regulator n=1 Tax=Rhodoligotrophos appendicifer TaxID=987056 RepID=UPI0011851942|nr:response regulator [Rhodoligotrophos appendicifer]